MDAGFPVQNVYLYCASAGLGTVARGSFKRPDVHNALKLTEKQEVVLVQPVGYLK
jgi:nitroreductase